MGYCTSADVYRIAGIGTDQVSEANVNSFIAAATAEVDRYTGTIWLFDAESDMTGNPTSATNTSLTDSGQSWTVDEFNNDYAVYISSGTGSGQIRQITDNDETSITVSTWTVNPDTDSVYEIFYSPLVSDTVDGSGNDTMFVKKHPLFSLSSLTIAETSITTSNVYQYDTQGKLVLSKDAEMQYFSNSYPQQVTMSYYYGVRPDSRYKSLIKDFTASITAMMALVHQIGGTFDDVTSYSFPEFNASKGEPYTNIREAWLKTETRMRTLRPLIPRYVQIG